MSGKAGFVRAAVVLVVWATAGPAGADVHFFPAPDTYVTATIGQIAPDQVGWFWSHTMAHEIRNTFDEALPEVGLAELFLDVPQNTLTTTPVQWGLVINDHLVGQFAVEPGFTGPLHKRYLFDPIPAFQGHFTVDLQVMNDVPLGEGGQTWGTGGSYVHQVRLVPEPATAALVLTALPALLGWRRRRKA